jgi:hypothetical protein
VSQNNGSGNREPLVRQAREAHHEFDALDKRAKRKLH